MNNTRYMRKIVKHHSRNLRREMSDAEKLLWRHLRMDQMGEYKFRRQHPLGNCVADFICLKAALVLEIDEGPNVVHSERGKSKARCFEANGLHVMRFLNNEVMSDIESVKLAIRNYLSTLQQLSLPFPDAEEANHGRGDR